MIGFSNEDIEKVMGRLDRLCRNKKGDRENDMQGHSAADKKE